jgi:hypothetical protein
VVECEGIVVRRRSSSLALIGGVVFLLWVPAAAAASKSPTKPVFLQKGNAICARGSAALEAAEAKLGSSPTKAQLTKYLQKTYVPNVRGQLAKLKALGYPAGDKATLQKLYSSAEHVLSMIAKSPGKYATTSTDPFTEPPRESCRLQPLRGWSHVTFYEVSG